MQAQAEYMLVQPEHPPPPRGSHPTQMRVRVPRPPWWGRCFPVDPCEWPSPWETCFKTQECTETHTVYTISPVGNDGHRVHLKTDGFVCSHIKIFWPFKANTKGTTHYHCWVSQSQTIKNLKRFSRKLWRQKICPFRFPDISRGGR